MTNAQIPNILIVGKQETVRRYVRESLAQGSYRCTCVSGAQEAVAAATDAAIDAALLDMPSFDPPAGLRLASWLRREVRDLPLVVITHASSLTLALEAMRLGATDCLHTPVSADDLCQAVERAVRWRRDALLARHASQRHVHEMARRAAALVRACAETGIGSPVALNAWVSTLYRRDPWTRGHVGRVADLSVLMAMMLGLDTRAVNEIGRVALLHDVGRLAIPEALTRKAQPLTGDEQTLMRTHVQVGYEIAVSTPYLEPLAVTLFTVRERFDGSGYPLGLRGETIPQGARVVAVAEAFDTLVGGQGVNDRSIDHANAELVRAAGTWFDPSVVHAWLRCVDGGVFGAVANAGEVGG